MRAAVNATRPSDIEVRAALGRVLENPAFRTSRKLTAFLRFVVERTLAGDEAHIKGYTIAVEALGRDQRFDPQSDPIVRVEAGRLRRALARYYASAGRDDEIVIDLPRGYYVPAIRRRSFPIGLRKLSSSARRQLFRQVIRRWRFLASVAIVTGIVSLILNMALLILRHPLTMADAKQPNLEAQQPAAASPFPLLYVEPFDLGGVPAESAAAFARLRNKLRDAFARFEEIEIVSDIGARSSSPAVELWQKPQSRGAYRLVANAEAAADRTASLSFQLHDIGDGTIVWTREFEKIHLQNPSADTEKEIVHRVASTIAQPYGVIYARELSKGYGHNDDPRYRCLLEAFDYYRTHDGQIRMRACVGRMVSGHPSFAAGFVALAFRYLRDYFDDANDIAALERAMAAAHRAIALDPESARAHQVMMAVLFARGEIAAALKNGEKAVALNPYDPFVLTSYGLRLLWAGQIERAMAVLERAVEYGSAIPERLKFALFLGAYVRGDHADAARHANQLVSRRDGYSLAARAIVAARTGDHERALLTVRRLVEQLPGWRDDPRRQIKRYGTPEALADRIVLDLETAGLRLTH